MATTYLAVRARHELCSPLTVIRGNAQVLRRRLAQVEGLASADAHRLWQNLTAIEAATAQLAGAADHMLPRR